MRTTITQSISFPPELLAKLKATAEKERRSVSNLVAIILEEGLKRR